MPQGRTDAQALVADQAWIALVSLHRRHPKQRSFSAVEIMESAKRENAYPEAPAGLQPHIYLHSVANLHPNCTTYRMFYMIGAASPRCQFSIIRSSIGMRKKYSHQRRTTSDEDPVLK